MNIVLITPYYEPDLGPSSPLVTMLCEDLTSLGHKVTVIAAVPHFPSGQVIDSYKGRLWRWEELRGVKVCRLWVPSGNRANLLHRLFVFLIYQILSACAGLTITGDVVIITNPAIETFLPYLLFNLLRKTPIIYCVWDLYPEVGVQVGIFRNRFIISAVNILENFCLNRAAVVQSLADNFVDNLKSRINSGTKLVVIPPWLDIDFIRPLPKDNAFSEENGIHNNFIVLYAGNLGLSQGLEDVLQAASKLQENSNVRFLLIGDGANKNNLIRLAKELNLKNIHFLPFQPRIRLPEILASADVSLVSMYGGVSSDSIPSKTYPIMASGRPVLAIVDKNSDIWKLIENSHAGICIEPNDSNNICETIQYLERSPQICKALGQNGRKHVANYHSRKTAAEKFNLLVLELGSADE